MKYLDRKKAGILFLVIGGLFFAAGVTLFIMSNAVNLYSQKAEAYIVGRYEVQTADGSPLTFLELNYFAGDQPITVTDSFEEEISEEQVSMTVYYNIKDPEKLVDAGWNFLPLGVIGLGIVILLPGLYYANILTFGIEPRKKLGKKASQFEKQKYEIRERVENGIGPLIGETALFAFGIVMIVIKGHGWLQWICVVIALLAILYTLIDFIPAVTQYQSMNKISKAKTGLKVVSTDDDFEKFEKELIEKDDEPKDDDLVRDNDE